MSTTTPPTTRPGPSRTAGVPVRTATVLTALAVALGTAFVLAPAPVAGSLSGGGYDGRRGLEDHLSASFADYWAAGERGFPPGLRHAVDYWSRYHLVKAVVAAVLLAVLLALGVLLRKAYLRAGGLTAGRRAALASAGAVVTALALFSLALVMANVQGTLAPFSSLLSMLPLHAPHGELAGTIAGITEQLAGYPDAGGATSPPVEVMVSDFGRYHAVQAAAATAVALTAAAMSAVSWRRFAAAAARDRWTRRVLRSSGLLRALLAAAVAVIAVANTATAADPAPALLAFFEGGW
ncbi:hypothetical protein EDD93_3801 [Streptomyces sp. 840.1]|uniref:hypothetical protein n=1 Tax=Streptomyces sp. 840.1 TaxID=2485152 RepID=UPI000FB176E2|nr:hypothetical protein [Streptomyces sp. 840.1]ROQ69303.1 hypothetical protein EDD93_3801 [Streptomyces sp. 840.1]